MAVNVRDYDRYISFVYDNICLDSLDVKTYRTIDDINT